jgi:amidase
MTFGQYVEYDGVGLAGLIATKQVTAAEVVEAAIERIERHNGTLNAVVYKAYEEARAAAKGKLSDGPLMGVPFLIKDLGLEVKGWPRTSGSRYTANAVDSRDSELTRRYRASGVVILGKTNTPEFGITGTTESARLGPCRNPWNPEHIAGGSSGGAAAAVASGMLPLAHASDGLGSIRIPAACCGLFGLKVTRDRNPNGPDDWDRATGMSVDHVVSRTVRDSATMLDATGYAEPASPYAPAPKAGPYAKEVERSPGKLKIAWSAETANGRPIDPEIEGLLEQTADTLKRLGHELVPRGLGVDYRSIYGAHRVISTCALAAQITRLTTALGREPKEDELEPLTWDMIRAGREVRGEAALLAWQTLRVRGRQILALFEEFDAYLCPVMGTPPPPIGYCDPVRVAPREVRRRQAGVFPFTPPFNFTGQPSMSLPLCRSKSGLPVGMMFSGRYGDEATLLRLAGQLEKECPWRGFTPRVWD